MGLFLHSRKKSRYRLNRQKHGILLYHVSIIAQMIVIVNSKDIDRRGNRGEQAAEGATDPTIAVI